MVVEKKKANVRPFPFIYLLQWNRSSSFLKQYPIRGKVYPSPSLSSSREMDSPTCPTLFPRASFRHDNEGGGPFSLPPPFSSLSSVKRELMKTCADLFPLSLCHKVMSSPGTEKMKSPFFPSFFFLFPPNLAKQFPVPLPLENLWSQVTSVVKQWRQKALPPFFFLFSLPFLAMFQRRTQQS